jgi:hypothetical protein
LSVLIVAGAIGGILAGISSVVVAGIKALQWKAEKGPVKVWFDSLGIGRAMYPGQRMIIVDARLSNPHPVPAIVESITLWGDEIGGFGLETLILRNHGGYTTEHRAIEVPVKQTITLKLGHSTDQQTKERTTRRYTLAVVLSDGTTVHSLPKDSDFLGF